MRGHNILLCLARRIGLGTDGLCHTRLSDRKRGKLISMFSIAISNPSLIGIMRGNMTKLNPHITDSAKQPQVVGAAGQHVWNLALELLSQVPPGSLLDAAAGGGALDRQLVARGFQVTAGDIVDQWQYPEIPFVVLDLDSTLPFEAGHFDTAILVEALGYLENPCHLIREFHRVVRTGGRVMISVPNTFSLQSRFRFLLNGTFRWFPHPLYSGEAKEALADVYRDPIRLTTLLFYLEKAGFEIERIEFGGKRAFQLMLPVGWFLQGLVRIHNRTRKGNRKRTPDFVNSTPSLLCANVGVLARNK